MVLQDDRTHTDDPIGFATMAGMTNQQTTPNHCLDGIRFLTLALNLPGPAAVMRCRSMGANCVKIEPPTGDPMRVYSALAYAQMHEGVRVVTLDLKSDGGQALLAAELAQADVFLTSFRPAALQRLGLDWPSIHPRFPKLCQVAVVGGAGEQKHMPGHDLTYMASHDLIEGLSLPRSLFADMVGALAVSEAVLQVLLQRQRLGHGVWVDVALEEAAAWAAWPRTVGMMNDAGPLAGGHSGYRVYACRDGRVAVAALEPHFARTLCALVGLAPDKHMHMGSPSTQAAMTQFFVERTREQLNALAQIHDLPLVTMAS
jgi:alpha-methylacyl-CoA racemase